MEAYKAKYFKKHVVYEAIEKERRYQDKKWGTIEENPHSLERWLAIMQGELSEAIDAFYDETREDVLAEIIQVVAVGHACLEQHGIVSFRNDHHQ